MPFYDDSLDEEMSFPEVRSAEELDEEAFGDVRGNFSQRQTVDDDSYYGHLLDS